MNNHGGNACGLPPPAKQPRTGKGGKGGKGGGGKGKCGGKEPRSSSQGTADGRPTHAKDGKEICKNWMNHHCSKTAATCKYVHYY